MKLKINTAGHIEATAETQEESVALFNLSFPVSTPTVKRGPYKKRKKYTRVKRCGICGAGYKNMGPHLAACIKKHPNRVSINPVEA